MTQRNGYKIQYRDGPWWQPRYRIMRQWAAGDRWAEIGRFYTLARAERWLTVGWWEDL